MKKYLALLLAFATVFSLTACGSGGMPTEPTDTPKPSGGAEHQHSYTETVTAPTCTEKGYTTFTCACGDTYTENTGPMGHTVQKNACISCGEQFAYSEGLRFKLNEDGQSYMLSGLGTCTDTVLYIPPEYNGLPVTKIERLVFHVAEHLTTVVIPNSITYIPHGKLLFPIFGYCTSLTNIIVELGNPVYHSAGNCIIETETKTLLSGCKNSAIPNDGSVKSIGSYAFSGCPEITSIYIPNSITNIEFGAFSDCPNLTSITIPSSVTSISSPAFIYCDELSSIVVDPQNPMYHSFENCIIETESKTLIQGCKTSVIPADGSVTSIGDNAFFYCQGLTDIVIPDSVTYIASGAFASCYSLTSITIPNSVTSIGVSAFYWCRSLTSITIPSSVTSIGLGAFTLCDLLNEIHYDGTVAQWNEISIQLDESSIIDAWDGVFDDCTVYCTDGEIEIGS